MPTGTIKWFNNDKGYGFVENAEGGKDVFLHISALERAGISSVREGQKIQFELQTGRDGRTSADDVKVLD